MVWKPNIRIMSRAFGWLCPRFLHHGVCPCTQLGDLRPSDRLPTFKSWLRHCTKIVTKYACNHVKCMLSLSCHYNTTPVTLRSAALEVFLNALYVWTVYHTNHKKTVWILNVLDDAVSIHLLYRNALDIHCKHTASQLHVAERVS